MATKLSKKRLDALWSEIQMAEALNKEELEPVLRESLARYVGTHYSDYHNVGIDILLNEVYPIIQNELPSIFFRTPRAFLKPRQKTYIAKERDPISGKMVEVQKDSAKSAKTQEGLLNYILQEIKYKKEARTVLLDALLFPHGVLWHGYKGDFGMTEEQSLFVKDEQIFVKRITPTRFIKDPCVTMYNLDEAKWQGRILDIPLIDILEDEELTIEKGRLKGQNGFGDRIGAKTTNAKTGQVNGQDTKTTQTLGKPLLDFAGKDFKSCDESKFIRVYEIYLRPTKKEKRAGSKGWILLLTDEQVTPLRESEWKIKAEGFPAHVLQFNELPDSLFGMADIDVYKSIADQKNIITNLQIRNAQETTKAWIAIAKDGADEHWMEAVKKNGNTIIGFDTDNINGKMSVMSPAGGQSSELYTLDQRIQRNLEDKSGVTDLKRGFLQSGEESATSVKIRAAGGGARPAYRQDIMKDFLRGSFTTINQLNKQFMTIKEAVRVMGTMDIEWTDNPTKQDIQADVDVEIDAISMLPENPDKEINELKMVLDLMVNALTNPQFLQKLQQEGKTFEISPVIEQMLTRLRILDPNIFRSIKPEESEGFVSVVELREAQQNIGAIVSGQQLPFPPKPEDDHRVKLEVYNAIKQLVESQGQTNELLDQLIQVQSLLMQQVQQKNETPGQQVNLKSPTFETRST